MKEQLLKLKSVPENLSLVEKFIDGICDEYNIHNNYFGNILIAITEAVENAMNHGNKNNQEKSVNINFESKSKGLSFTVTDEGEGYDFDNIADPTNILNNGSEGRGIFMIKSLADEVNISNSGKSIELIFYIASINAELALNRVSQLAAYSQSSVKLPKLS